MKKSSYFWTVLSALVMLGLPWAAATFVKGPDGTWLLFDPGEPAFLRYALIYLAIGFAAALAAHALSSKHK